MKLKMKMPLMLGLIFALAATKMVFYFIYAGYDLGMPYEAFHLESKMVLLAYRVQVGALLYPDWHDYPHVANFFGPVYFVIVGLLGRLAKADIPSLFTIGRGVTFTAMLATTGFIALYLKRTCGWWAAIVGAMISLGGNPMFGFSVMVRADLLAEAFGTAGFLLSIQQARSRRLLGCVLLATAVLTKQTTAVFLVAGALALFLEGARREALVVFVTSTVLVALAIAILTIVREPRFATDFLGEGKTPWLFEPWYVALKRMTVSAPDYLLVPILTLLLVKSRGGRESALLALTVVLMAASLITSAKRGADLNYYLNLRVCEGLAAGILWKKFVTAETFKQRVGARFIGVLVVLALMQSTIFSMVPAETALRKYEFRNSRVWPSVARTHAQLIQIAENPDRRLLTDSGLLDLYQGERAAFGDPWLFRMMVETGRINPTKMKRWIEAEEYDMVVTTHDLTQPSYVTYEFGLPMLLVESINAHYVPAGTLNNFFIYTKRGAKATPLSSVLNSSDRR